MRRTVSLITVIAAMLAVSPARAQAYDPAYPICIQGWGVSGSSISCRYTSMEQCQLSASGRAAQCMANPYFARVPARR